MDDRSSGGRSSPQSGKLKELQKVRIHSLTRAAMICSFIPLFALAPPSFAQSPVSPTMPATPSNGTDSTELKSTYLFVAVGGFIPFGESYRLNYSTKLGASWAMQLPIEVSGGFLFPVTKNLLVPITARYVRREANFVAGTSIGVVSIEPGVRFFLEREHERDLRLFGVVEGLLAQATVSGNYDISTDGSVTGIARAQKDYYNLGLGFDLGLMYPITSATAIDAMVHIAIFLASPIAHGGLGDIGGVSLTAAYRFGF